MLRLTLIYLAAMAALAFMPRGYGETRDETRLQEFFDERRTTTDAEFQRQDSDARMDAEEERWDQYRGREGESPAATNEPEYAMYEIEPQPRPLTPKEREQLSVQQLHKKFINPRPDLGCMYHDAYGSPHWWPGCREVPVARYIPQPHVATETN